MNRCAWTCGYYCDDLISILPSGYEWKEFDQKLDQSLLKQGSVVLYTSDHSVYCIDSNTVFNPWINHPCMMPPKCGSEQIKSNLISHIIYLPHHTKSNSNNNTKTDNIDKNNNKNNVKTDDIDKTNIDSGMFVYLRDNDIFLFFFLFSVFRNGY